MKLNISQQQLLLCACENPLPFEGMGNSDIIVPEGFSAGGRMQCGVIVAKDEACGMPHSQEGNLVFYEPEQGVVEIIAGKEHILIPEAQVKQWIPADEIGTVKVTARTVADILESHKNMIAAAKAAVQRQKLMTPPPGYEAQAEKNRAWAKKKGIGTP